MVNYSPVDMNLGPFSETGQRICFNINITDNQDCNNDPNLNFTVVMSRQASDDEVVIVVPIATVVIDDSREPECGKNVNCASFQEGFLVVSKNTQTKVRSRSIDPQKSRHSFLITGQNFQHHVTSFYSAVLLICI